jgi:hypothetical protein
MALIERFVQRGEYLIYSPDYTGGGPQFHSSKSLADGSVPTWSLDGKELYWIGPDGRMMAATIIRHPRPLYSECLGRRLSNDRSLAKCLGILRQRMHLPFGGFGDLSDAPPFVDPTQSTRA